jgi:hypothetical protein
MVAHSGFITVARKVEKNIWNVEQLDSSETAAQQDDNVIMEDEHADNGLDTL